MSEIYSYREPENIIRNENEGPSPIYELFLRDTGTKEILRIRSENRNFNDLREIASILESNYVNPELDSFISTIIEYHPRVNPSLDQPARLTLADDAFENPARPIPGYPNRRFFRSDSGLQISMGHSISGLTIQGAQAGRDEGVARVDFTPGGRTSFVPERITESLACGIQGIRELVRAVEEGQIDDIQTLVGTTNINMALIAQRLGFTIVDQDRTPDGKIDVTKGSFTVVATMQDVKARVREFEESGRFDRVQSRHQRRKASGSSRQ